MRFFKPGISISNRCIFLCLAINVPFGSKTVQVLYNLFVSEHRSGIEPPIRKILLSLAACDKALIVSPSSQLFFFIKFNRFNSKIYFK